MTSPSVLLLIPAHNEQDRIEPTLRKFAQYAREKYPGLFKLVVVINGTTDDTAGVVRKVSADFPNVDFVDFPDRIGKGGALIEGLKLAPQADLIGFVDADGSTGPASFFNLVQECSKADCVVGSRRMVGSQIHQYQPSHRQLASKVFHFIVQTLFWMDIHDTQCGAKVMRQSAVVKIQHELTISDMAFDVNLLYALKREGCKVIEAPVEWTDTAGSKVRYFRTSLIMFLSVLRLRLFYSPLYKMLRPLRPLETWIYAKLHAPPPRRSLRGRQDEESQDDQP